MFKKLGEITGETDLLTVRCTKAWLEMEAGMPTLHIMIDDSMEAITSSRQRKEHFQSTSPWLRSQLDIWQNKKGGQILVATPQYPLEVITGDVCLILIIEGKRYLVSAFRDIDPIGWIIPGGCPKDKEELFNPLLTALRESVEEVSILDTPLWPPLEKLSPKGGHASRVIVHYADDEFVTDGVNITISPETASVSVTFYWELYLPTSFNDLRISDGEKLPDGNPLNRPVRLTDESGKTVAIFCKGRDILSAGWHLPSDEMRMFIP